MEGYDLHMNLEGKVVDILSKINPSQYTKYATNFNNKKMMHVKLKNALYRTLQTALIFWKNLTNVLF